jgi:hypothetical protein
MGMLVMQAQLIKKGLLDNLWVRKEGLNADRLQSQRKDHGR